MRKGLHIVSSGEGPDLVMLHGWGMNAEIWQPLSSLLANQFRLHRVDLPGHGQSQPYSRTATLENWVEQVAESVIPHLSGPACWLGWSLGGMVAIQLAASYPQQVKRLLLMATNLRFCQATDWPDAVAVEVLQGFATELQQDHHLTLQRFLGLQVMGDSQARDTLKQLRQCVLAQPEPATGALQSGLEILRNADLRPLAKQLDLPVLLIGGEKDRLVSPAAMRKVSSLLPQCQLEILPAAGHAPFISQPESFVKLVKAYCEQSD